jgi:hypothetical protein
VIGGYLNQTAQKKVETAAVFYDDEAAAELELEEITVSIDFRLKVRLEGGTGSGTVTITGELDGSPVSETITFTSSPRTKYSSNTYDTLTSITTSGLADEDPAPNITVTAVDELLHEITTTSWQNFACRWEEKGVSYWNSLGQLTLSDGKVITEEAIEAGDTIRINTGDVVGHEVKSVKSATGLEGAEEFRTLLL